MSPATSRPPSLPSMPDEFPWRGLEFKVDPLSWFVPLPPLPLPSVALSLLSHASVARDREDAVETIKPALVPTTVRLLGSMTRSFPLRRSSSMVRANSARPILPCRNWFLTSRALSELSGSASDSIAMLRSGPKHKQLAHDVMSEIKLRAQLHTCQPSYNILPGTYFQGYVR